MVKRYYVGIFPCTPPPPLKVDPRPYHYHPQIRSIHPSIHPSVRQVDRILECRQGSVLICGDYREKNSPLATNIGQLLFIELFFGEQYGQIKNFSLVFSAWQLMLNSRSGLKTALLITLLWGIPLYGYFQRALPQCYHWVVSLLVSKYLSVPQPSNFGHK